MAEKLKPSPFCGAEAELRGTSTHFEEYGRVGSFPVWAAVHCDECGFSLGEEYPDEAIAAWNRRVPDAELVEALKLAQTIIGHPDDAGSKFIASVLFRATGEQPDTSTEPRP